MFAAWLIVLFWLLTILVSLLALFTNSYNLLLPHLFWTVRSVPRSPCPPLKASVQAVLCVISTCCSLTLFISETRPWTMILSTGIAVLLGTSVVVETKCFRAMRRCLR